MRAVVVSGVLAGALALGGCTAPEPEPISTVTALDGLIVDVTSPSDIYPISTPLSDVGPSGELVVQFSEDAALLDEIWFEDDFGVAVVNRDGSTEEIVPPGHYESRGRSVWGEALVSESTVAFVEVVEHGRDEIVFYDRASATVTRVPTSHILDGDSIATDLRGGFSAGVLVDDRLYVIVGPDDSGQVIVELTADGETSVPLGEIVLGDVARLGRDVCGDDLAVWSQTFVGDSAFTDVFRVSVSDGRPTAVDDASRLNRVLDRDSYDLREASPQVCEERWFLWTSGFPGVGVVTSGPRASDADVWLQFPSARRNWNGTWATAYEFIDPVTGQNVNEYIALVNTHSGDVHALTPTAPLCDFAAVTGEWIAWEEATPPGTWADDAPSLGQCVIYVGRLPASS